jgi:hypothetical protein
MLCQTLPGGGREGEPRQKTAKDVVFLLIRVPKVFVSHKCALPRDFYKFKHERGYGLVSVLIFSFRRSFLYLKGQ